MPLSLFLCQVLDWYHQAHPRPVCQSNEFLRVEKIPSISCLASFAEDVEGVCWLGHATICVVLVLVFCVWGWLLLIKMRVATVVMISLLAVFAFREDTPLARWNEERMRCVGKLLGEILLSMRRKCRGVFSRGIVFVLVACLLAEVWPSLCNLALSRMRGPLVEVWLVHRDCPLEL